MNRFLIELRQSLVTASAERSEALLARERLRRRLRRASGVALIGIAVSGTAYAGVRSLTVGSDPQTVGAAMGELDGEHREARAVGADLSQSRAILEVDGNTFSISPANDGECLLSNAPTDACFSQEHIDRGQAVSMDVHCSGPKLSPKPFEIYGISPAGTTGVEVEWSDGRVDKATSREEIFFFASRLQGQGYPSRLIYVGAAQASDEYRLAGGSDPCLTP